MRFFFNSAEYSLSFQRKHDQITTWDKQTVQSRHPLTFVTLEKIERDETNKVTSRTKVLEDKAITAKGDAFSFEKGRLAALRNLTRTLSTQKDFKKAIWKAYTTRQRG